MQSLAASTAQADGKPSAEVTGSAVWRGKMKDVPPLHSARVPVVLFMHGSSGLGLKAIGEWQLWLRLLGIAERCARLVRGRPAASPFPPADQASGTVRTHSRHGWPRSLPR